MPKPKIRTQEPIERPSQETIPQDTQTPISAQQATQILVAESVLTSDEAYLLSIAPDNLTPPFLKGATDLETHLNEVIQSRAQFNSKKEELQALENKLTGFPEPDQELRQQIPESQKPNEWFYTIFNLAQQIEETAHVTPGKSAEEAIIAIVDKSLPQEEKQASLLSPLELEDVRKGTVACKNFMTTGIRFGALEIAGKEVYKRHLSDGPSPLVPIEHYTSTVSGKREDYNLIKLIKENKIIALGRNSLNDTIRIILDPRAVPVLVQEVTNFEQSIQETIQIVERIRGQNSDTAINQQLQEIAKQINGTPYYEFIVGKNPKVFPPAQSREEAESNEIRTRVDEAVRRINIRVDIPAERVDIVRILETLKTASVSTSINIPEIFDIMLLLERSASKQEARLSLKEDLTQRTRGWFAATLKYKADENDQKDMEQSLERLSDQARMASDEYQNTRNRVRNTLQPALNKIRSIAPTLIELAQAQVQNQSIANANAELKNQNEILILQGQSSTLQLEATQTLLNQEALERARIEGLYNEALLDLERRRQELEDSKIVYQQGLSDQKIQHEIALQNAGLENQGLTTQIQALEVRVEQEQTARDLIAKKSEGLMTTLLSIADAIRMEGPYGSNGEEMVPVIKALVTSAGEVSTFKERLAEKNGQIRDTKESARVLILALNQESKPGFNQGLKSVLLQISEKLDTPYRLGMNKNIIKLIISAGLTLPELENKLPQLLFRNLDEVEKVLVSILKDFPDASLPDGSRVSYILQNVQNRNYSSIPDILGFKLNK